MAGYIKDYRQELDSSIWTMPPLYHRVWQYLKYKACFRETELKLKDGSLLKIGPGQYFTSVREIAKDVAWKERGVLQIPNPKMINSVLKWLESEEMITFRGVTGNTPNEKTSSGGNSLGTLVTLVKWAFYQSSEDESNAKVTPLPVTGNENKNKDLKNNNAAASLNTAHAPEESTWGDGMPITGPAVDEISPFQAIEQRFIAKRGSGFFLTADDCGLIQGLITDEIPMATVLAGIDDAFERYEPKFKGDRIRHFSYCDPVIRDRHYREQARKEPRAHESDRRSVQSGRASPQSGGSTRSPVGQGYYDQHYPGLITIL